MSRKDGTNQYDRREMKRLQRHPQHFKQGYACTKCVSEDKVTVKRDALYVRLKSKMQYSGYVMCPKHGITQGIPLKDVMK